MPKKKTKEKTVVVDAFAVIQSPQKNKVAIFSVPTHTDGKKTLVHPCAIFLNYEDAVKCFNKGKEWLKKNKIHVGVKIVDCQILYKTEN